MLTKQALILKRDELKSNGSYLATKAFEKERSLLYRIKKVLLIRYGII